MLGHSRALKNEKMPHFDQFPRPGESDSYMDISNNTIIRTKKFSLVRSMSELCISMFEDISSSGSAGRSSPWTTCSGSTTASTGHFLLLPQV